jgi:hypothetical protein
MHYVHYREPTSGKEPNASLSLAQVQAEKLLQVPGNTNIQEGSTVATWNLQNECFIASSSNCLLLADFTKDPKGN